MNELVKYVKRNGRRTGDRCGVVVATAEGIGWSFCNRKAGDTFSKHTGIKIARDRAKFGSPAMSSTPHDVVPVIKEMSERRKAYFKV